MAYTDIDKPDDYFNTVLYTGTGSATSITGVGFQPDLVWIKRRNTTSSHRLVDVVRGATNYLQSDTTDAEGSTGNVSSFDSDGFSHSAGGVAYNASGSTYASWNWLAGGTGVSNTQGSITSTVSANTTSGFSIVSYTGNSTTGATVGHGLGVAPKMIIIKNRTNTYEWVVGHTSLGWGNTLFLNDTSAINASGYFNASPTSSVFELLSSIRINSTSNNYIAYCFADVKGFSKFGSYTGNGNADGTFVYTGFKPAFTIIKRTNGASQWRMRDNKRDTYNVVNHLLYPNGGDAEAYPSTAFDYLSNGIKIRDAAADINGSGNTYIYMAFAENPFTTSTGIPTTAR